MQYYDNMRAGTDDFFTTFLGLQLQMSLFIRDTSGSPSGRVKIYDVDDDTITNGKGPYITNEGNTPYREYIDNRIIITKTDKIKYGIRNVQFATKKYCDIYYGASVIETVNYPHII